MDVCYSYQTGLPATVVSLPVHLSYCCQSSLFKTESWSCSKTFDGSLPLVKAQLHCIGIRGPLELKQPIFLASSLIISPRFWVPWSNMLISICTMNSHTRLSTGCVFANPSTWPAKLSSGFPSHLLHISIITHHSLLNWSFFFPVSPIDHELLVYKGYIWPAPVFPELSTGPHINNESAKDCLSLLMA